MSENVGKWLTFLSNGAGRPFEKPFKIKSATERSYTCHRVGERALLVLKTEAISFHDTEQAAQQAINNAIFVYDCYRKKIKDLKNEQTAEVTRTLQNDHCFIVDPIR